MAKVDDIQQEKQRRTMGKEMNATREQMEKEEDARLRPNEEGETSPKAREGTPEGGDRKDKQSVEHVVKT